MKKKSKLFNIFIYLCLVIFALSILVPVFWVFMASIKTNPEFYGNPWALPMSFYLNNFKDAWAAANMGDYFLNSLIVTAIALALLLLISLPFSYILARMQFKGRRFVTSYIKAGLFINLSYIVIPIFLMLRDVSKSIPLALLNNRFVLALIYASTAVPFTVYLLTNFFSSISKSYEEAAYIDGAGYYRTMMDIMIPMARPAVITVILFNFLSFWNEIYFSPNSYD